MSRQVEPTPYIRNSWYPASWSDALTSEPIARTFLEEEVVLYRGEHGQVIALSNVCPHRFAALAKGRIYGDAIECPYHGLRFGSDGRCVRNPHGPAPGAARIQAYPVAEKLGMIWIWMGDPARADTALLPENADREDERFDWVQGYLHVEGNYQLVIDNLLDLTHVEFLHPFLANVGESHGIQVKCFEDGDEIVSRYYHNDTLKTLLVSSLWDDVPDRMSMVAEMRWSAPAILFQENRFDVAEKEERCEGRLLLPFCHLITPETKYTSHYFWGNGRNMKRGIDEVSAALATGISQTFMTEDEPMIADIQKRMGDRELLELKPLLLSMDKSAVLARRKVDAILKAEALGSARLARTAS